MTTDIITGENFFVDQNVEDTEVIVTNPPYSIKYPWLERCYQIGKRFALLVPLEMIGAARAQVQMKQHGAEIMLLDKRVNFGMPNKGFEGSSAQFPVCWLCHGILPAPIVYGHIEYPNKQELAGQLALAL